MSRASGSSSDSIANQELTHLAVLQLVEPPDRLMAGVGEHLALGFEHVGLEAVECRAVVLDHRGDDGGQDPHRPFLQLVGIVLFELAAEPRQRARLAVTDRDDGVLGPTRTVISPSEIASVASS